MKTLDLSLINNQCSFLPWALILALMILAGAFHVHGQQLPANVDPSAPIFQFGTRSVLPGTRSNLSVATLSQLIPSTGTSRRAVAYQSGQRVIKNPAVNALAPWMEEFSTGVTSFEPTVAVLFDGSILFSAASLDVTTGNSIDTTVRSDDGGKTWFNAGRKGAPPFANITLDPFVYVDRLTGRGFIVDFADSNTRTHTDSFSEDGINWNDFTASPMGDHENVSAGPPRTSIPVGYPNVVYLCGISQGLGELSQAGGCLKSLDGGTTWAVTGADAFMNDPNSSLLGDLGIPGQCGGALGHSFVDLRGNLYLPKGYCGVPMLAISHDEGRTWTRATVSNLGMPVINLVEGTTAFAIKDHEASVVVDVLGNIYYAWTAQDHLLYLTISRDGGNTFSKPLNITPPGVNETWTAKLDIDNFTPGRIAVTFMGTTQSPGGPFCVETTPTGCVDANGNPPQPDSAYANVAWNGYVVSTENALDSDPVFFAATVNDPDTPLVKGKCNNLRCGAEGDFLGERIGPDGTVWSSFVNACPADQTQPCVPIGVGVLGRLTHPR